LAKLDGGLERDVQHRHSGRNLNRRTIRKDKLSNGCAARILQDEERIRPAGSEVLRLCGDNRKLAAATGFKPGVSLDSGLAQTNEWFRNPANLAKYKGHLYNV
jgi:nucleoside-diphosphate-sugar epimerase